MSEWEDKALVKAYDQAQYTVFATEMAASRILFAARQARQLASAVLQHDGYQYPSDKIADLRNVESLLGRVVLEAIAERARR